MKYIISFFLRFVPRKVLQLFSDKVLKVMAIFYRGNNVFCPIEGKGYRKFLPYGRINPRENALCPGSLSLERHRLLWLYFNQKTNFFKTKLKMLHVAPEVCFMKPFEQQHGNGYITGDIESPLAKIKMDVHNIPFKDNSFDVAMCNHVMEHVNDDTKAMKEFYRVLKPGGWAIFQVPFFHPIPDSTFEDASIITPKEREKVYGQDDHVRLYGKDYANRLRQAGFKVTEDDFVMQLPDEEVKKYALPNEEVIFFCEKKL
ncbi:MAG: methyltransferase domain-containing protein [Cyclobacteriaceae bacterium]|nr:methyltransferase domain-containing protein [Cyclobacteriaceae bacterium]